MRVHGCRVYFQGHSRDSRISCWFSASFHVHPIPFLSSPFIRAWFLCPVMFHITQRKRDISSPDICFGDVKQIPKKLHQSQPLFIIFSLAVLGSGLHPFVNPVIMIGTVTSFIHVHPIIRMMINHKMKDVILIDSSNMYYIIYILGGSSHLVSGL